ncbi:MAG TPA: peptidoglycan endopeptidase [Desulfuromonadales bacterium]|nr:peptidoglycan endopeptidase [Desulfuromonadales bacterium]
MMLYLAALTIQTAQGETGRYGVVRSPAPVLNSADFKALFGGTDGIVMKSDRCGQLRELEFIALPGSVFTIREQLKSGSASICRVDTEEYTAAAGVKLYVDCRFLEFHESAPPQRSRRLPERADIVASLKKSVGSSYVWGGNVTEGVPELMDWWYGDNAGRDQHRLTLSGLDCSGLLYRASGGWTPRNSSQLLTYGRPLAVARTTAEQIAAILQPLDLIVWDGHVVIVLDRTSTIESILACGRPGKGGVVITPLIQRLKEIMRSRTPADRWPQDGKKHKSFVVRRWYGL